MTKAKLSKRVLPNVVEQHRIKEIQDAAVPYLGAHVAHRDAKRLLAIGLAAATEKHRRVLLMGRTAPATLAEVIEVVAVKEALDLITLFESNASRYIEGRNAETAFRHARRCVLIRYANGKCDLCKGPALECAQRHARGRSCA